MADEVKGKQANPIEVDDEVVSKVSQEDLLKIIQTLQAEIGELKQTTKTKKKIGPRPKKKAAKVKLNKKTIKKVKKAVERTEEEIQAKDAGKLPTFEVNRTPGRARFTKNQWVDNGSLCRKEKEWDKKYGDKYFVTERNNAPVQMIAVKCEHCPDRQTLPSTSPSLQKLPGCDDYYYVCAKCARKGISS